VLAATVEEFLDAACERLDLSAGLRAWLATPDRELRVKVPLVRDDGELVAPDQLANTGGVIVSHLEWVQNRVRERWPQADVEAKLHDALTGAIAAAVERAEREDVPLRLAAYLIAVERVLTAARLRGSLPG
jgi:glutamate dehydrogenase/leucine dehydrogenase